MSDEERDVLWVQRVDPVMLPLELLDQKPGYNVEEYLQYAVAAPDQIHAFVIYRGDEAISCFWCHYSRLYKQVHIDTFVVDKEARVEDTARDCMRITIKVCEGLAKEFGASRVTWSSPPKLADHMIKVIDDPRLAVAEWILAVNLDEELVAEEEPVDVEVPEVEKEVA